MRVITAEATGVDADGFLSPLDNELHLNAFCTSSLRDKISAGRGWEEGLAGLVRQALAIGEHTGLPGWKSYRFKDSSTIFEFESLAEWITDPNGLGTTYDRLAQLLKNSPTEEGRRLATDVDLALKLPVGQPSTSNGNNIPITSKEAAAEVRESERGTSAPGVRRRIRNWIQQNPQAPNIEVAKQWLATLEGNPRSRLHQQALREIGIGKTKRVLDISNVSEPLIERLYDLAKAEEMSVSEVIEDALAVYFAMDDEAGDGPAPTPESSEQPGTAPAAKAKAKPKASGNGKADTGELKPIPEPGFYSVSKLAKATGISTSGVHASASSAEDGGEILKKTLAGTPVMAIVHKENLPAERYEVRHR
jgi:hypothetical protein